MASPMNATSNQLEHWLELASRQGGNAGLLAFSVVAIVYLWQKSRGAHSDWGRDLCLGMIVAIVGFNLRSDPWLVCAWLREPPASYAQWCWDWSPWFQTLSALLVAIGFAICGRSFGRTYGHGRYAFWALFGFASAWVIGAALVPM